MDFDEFVAALNKTRKTHKWRCDHRGRIRSGTAAEQKLYCPLTAVSNSLGDKYYSTGEATYAAADLCMSQTVANDIMNAADNHLRPDHGFSGMDMCSIRAKLLAAVGIKVEHTPKRAKPKTKSKAK